eukprot:CFRG7585T1
MSDLNNEIESEWPFFKIPTDDEIEGNLKKVKEMKEEMARKAMLIIKNIMPEKIIQLNNLFKLTSSSHLVAKDIPAPLRTSAFTLKDLEAIHIDTVTWNKSLQVKVLADGTVSKKRKLDDVATNGESECGDAEVPCNDLVISLLKVLKMEILQLVEFCNTVKIWIQLNIPRIEDGNNFGVSIQEETVNELSRAEDSGFTVLESITKYFVMRAKLASKVLKYPTIMDYRLSVNELDEKEYVNLRLCAQDLRNNYSILHDMITKNMEKIKKPRSSNSSASMY